MLTNILLVLVGTLLIFAIMVILLQPYQAGSYAKQLVQITSIAVLAALLLSPIDLVPEVMFPAGFVDDLGYLLGGIKLLRDSSPNVAGNVSSTRMRKISHAKSTPIHHA